ncbi:MAG: TonB-dependent receptor [Flavobacteriaceae bacterium]|nr:TonB-dependent receptor [Flavobacteriaceae bacterium]
MKKMYLVMAAFLFTAVAFAQVTVTGTVTDGELGGGLPGANVLVKGTTTGASADFDGKFSLTTSKSSGVLVVSYMGYTTKEVSFSGSGDLGTIALMPDASILEGVVIIASVAKDRETPVAVSNIRAEDIEIKLGTQEFPEILKSTPGVYATKSGGGFGDGRVNLRGFNSENVAVMINGVPVNDMENGRVYWSNWAGLADVTGDMQVQRGLGASKVAVPSVGGTINILTKSTDMEKGGNIYTAVGNDGFQKYGFTLSTGKLDNGWAATVSASRTTGEGYVDGTQFQGANYFVNIAKEIGENHLISLTSFGAPQRHGQRQNMSPIADYRNADSGIRFNPDWGIKNGQITHIEDNFYHKNQTSLNHIWTISEKSLLSTAAYASWGSGGGGGTAGTNTELFKVRLGGDDQPVDLDNIVEINRENGNNGLGSEAYLRASRNDHRWYGILSTLKTELTEDIDLLGGIDLRTYTGIHFSEITDLLGGDFVLEDSDVNNPNRLAKVGDKRDYNNDGKVGWQGVFLQGEYSKDALSAFVSVAASNTSYKRIDYFQYTSNDPLRESDRYNYFGYSAKGGANYNLNENHNVFANIGYFEKAPNFRAVFPRFNNVDINEDAENEKIFSVELGYGYRSSKLAANVNLYRTAWNDRSTTSNFQADGQRYFANLLGVNALHQGVEFDFDYRPSDRLRIIGMLSLGDWTWTDNIENVQIFDEDQNPVGKPFNLFIEDLKVSDAAQTTASLGLDYEFMEDVNITVDYNYYDNLYARYDPAARVTAQPQSWEAPDYGLFDASLRYRFKLGNFDTTLIGRMNNVFNTEYIADAIDGNGHDAASALVWYGFGRTFNISAKFRF